MKVATIFEEGKLKLQMKVSKRCKSISSILKVSNNRIANLKCRVQNKSRYNMRVVKF